MERPAFIRHWRELETPDIPVYPDDAANARHPEWMAIGAPLGRALDQRHFRPKCQPQSER